MCQDTGTAIIMGKKGRLVFTDGSDEGALGRGRARRLPQAQSALFAAGADFHVRGEEHQVEHAGAGRDLCRGRGRLQIAVHRQRRRLGQQGVSVPGDAVDPDARPHDRVPQGEGAHARHRGVPALSSGDRDRRHLGRADHEDGQARLDALLRRAADQGLGGRARVPRSRDGSGSAEADAVVSASARSSAANISATTCASSACRATAPRCRSGSACPAPPTARRSARSPATACSSSSSSIIRRNICRTSTRRNWAARWSRSISTGR